jgi:hypothetical protein
MKTINQKLSIGQAVDIDSKLYLNWLDYVWDATQHYSDQDFRMAMPNVIKGMRWPPIIEDILRMEIERL